MHILASLALALAPTAALAGSAHPQLFLSPAPPRLAHLAHPLHLDAPQTNAVLAHHLGVQHHVHLPLPTGKTGRDWEVALDDPPSSSSLGAPQDTPRIVVVLECPKSGCHDALPAEFAALPALSLPALPSHSYLAAVTLHLHRLADALGLDADSPAVQGLQDLVDDGVKSVAGWQGWIGDDLARWIGYGENRKKPKTAVEPQFASSGLVTDLDLLDPSAAQLVLELEKLAALADDVASSNGRADSGPQGASDVPRVVVVHLKGLKDIAAAHALTSPLYARASALVRQTLTGALASLRARLPASEQPTVLLLALPPHAQPLLRKREAWLKPFEAGGAARYGAQKRAAKGAREVNAHKKRSVFSPRAPDEEAGKGSGPLVPAGKTCFASLSALNNATASCLKRGEGVKGVSTRGGECWVCRCKTTEDDEGRKRRWSGEGCEKEDLSGSALLLAGTTVFLALLVAGSVALLYNIGDVPLPGTLSAVSGMAGHAKRD
ncbi:hypothetical protein JCM10450v2_005139 [Rhodotorula kratochvilovae]